MLQTVVFGSSCTDPYIVGACAGELTLGFVPFRHGFHGNLRSFEASRIPSPNKSVNERRAQTIRVHDRVIAIIVGVARRLIPARGKTAPSGLAGLVTPEGRHQHTTCTTAPTHYLDHVSSGVCSNSLGRDPSGHNYGAVTRAL